MYNIYTEEKKASEKDKKLKEEKEEVIYNEKHKIKTNNLVNNYQKRIKKFIIDVREILYNIYLLIILCIDGRRKSPHRN